MDVASQTRDVMIHSYLSFMAISLLVYDHLVTFEEEVAYIWRRPKLPSSLLFLLNRYLGFIGNVAATSMSFVSLSPKSCSSYSLFRQLLLVANQVLVCLLLTLRTYALYGRNKRVLAFMLTCGMGLAAAAVWTLVGQHAYPATIPGCHMAYDTSTAIHLAVAWEALFVYDSIVFFLTLAKTYKAGLRSGLFSSARKMNILVLICRDGALYYAIMAMANLANILTYYAAPPLMRGGLSTFASSISVTLMSRLMLNLHKTADIGIFSTYVPQRYDTDAEAFTTYLDSDNMLLTD
ncbi:hypothetical protein HYDPIDRAFT_112783 [Hydnomerulius pinastri MD-312]|uniref:DUF6533 domain-containing protein n=1 Tax=Hydnomerulius pinastri MD-312 TaxID=994086 RepID=A0A0C9VZF1_9AGAM|nr:hypothetical protein HYDPIDRAFT_112783 [Hydnomerulius pinastri MD-312]